MKGRETREAYQKGQINSRDIRPREQRSEDREPEDTAKEQSKRKRPERQTKQMNSRHQDERTEKDARGRFPGSQPRAAARGGGSAAIKLGREKLTEGVEV